MLRFICGRGIMEEPMGFTFANQRFMDGGVPQRVGTG